MVSVEFNAEELIEMADDDSIESLILLRYVTRASGIDPISRWYCVANGERTLVSASQETVNELLETGEWVMANINMVVFDKQEQE